MDTTNQSGYLLSHLSVAECVNRLKAMHEKPRLFLGGYRNDVRVIRQRDDETVVLFRRTHRAVRSFSGHAAVRITLLPSDDGSSQISSRIVVFTLTILSLLAIFFVCVFPYLMMIISMAIIEAWPGMLMFALPPLLATYWLYFSIRKQRQVLREQIATALEVPVLQLFP